MRSAFFSFAFFLWAPVSAVSPYFSEIMANTSDDATLEYFAIANPSCEPFPLGGYSVADASWKVFVFPTSAVLDPFSQWSFWRTETKIALNNENERLSLFDSFGALVDDFSYSTSTKGVSIRREPSGANSCETPSGLDGNSDELPDASPPSEEEPLSQDEPSFSEFPDDGEIHAEPQNADAPAVPSSATGSDSGSSDGFSSGASVAETGAVVPEISDPAIGSGDWSSGTGTGTGVSEPMPNSSSWTAADIQSPTVATTALSAASTSAASSVAATASTVSPSVTMSSASVPPSVSKAVAETLKLVDSNGDSAFDFVEIGYSEPVFWTPDPNEFLLYSKTGGLYEWRIATASGFFSQAVVVGSILRLAFSWETLPKTAFRIDVSTSSEFRIKTVSGMSSLKTVSSWLPAMPLWLTTSFSGYSSERISFVPAFPEPIDSQVENGSPEDIDNSDSASVSGGSEAVSDEASSSWADTEADVKAEYQAVGEGGSSVQEGGATSVQGVSKRAQVPKGVSIVPSSWIDFLPNGKYRQVCFSKTCSPSFKVEWLPSKTKGYWKFSDGRKRYGASTSTLWKAVPAEYRLAFVLELSEGTAEIPIELSVMTEAQAEALFVRTQTVSKSVASSLASVADGGILGAMPPESASGKTSTPKSPKISTVVEASQTEDGRAISIAVASAFVGLSVWAGWLAYRRRAWLPEETP